jgi:hypothetical protein
VAVSIIGRKNGGDMNSVRALSLGQHRNNTLEPAFSRGRKNVKYPDPLAQPWHRSVELNDVSWCLPFSTFNYYQFGANRRVWYLTCHN